MVKKKGLIIFFIIFVIIGLIHGLISGFMLNFISWILIGVWLILLFKILENIKRHREFNSPHNTAFFVILPLFIGIIYSVWAPFSGFLGENLNGTSIYISWWSLIFAFPFILLGLVISFIPAARAWLIPLRSWAAFVFALALASIGFSVDIRSVLLVGSRPLMVGLLGWISVIIVFLLLWPVFL